MSAHSILRYLILMLATATCAGVMGAGVAWLVLPAVNWGAAGVGWLVAVLNSLIGRLINDRAVGRSRNAFVGWGLAANAFRMLTLVGIFAYMALRYPGVRGSFFVTGFVTFFPLMGVEVASLFKSQNKDGK